MMHGIDISHHNGDWQPEQASVLPDFVILKATEGEKWRDPKFEEYYSLAQRIPVRGAYHYFRTGVDVRRQVDNFLSCIEGKEFDLLALDFEAQNNELTEQAGHQAYDWCLEVMDRAARPVLIYVNKYDSRFLPTPAPEAVRLWLAWWSPMKHLYWPDDLRPLPQFGRPAVWQYSSRGNARLYGLTSAYVDLNRALGTARATRYYSVAVRGLYVREGPGTEYSKVDVIPLGTMVKERARALDGTGAVWLRHDLGWSCLTGAMGQYLRFEGIEKEVNL